MTMDAFSSPVRLMPPQTPRRAPSPIMSPGGRRGRAHGHHTDDSRLRDLSPETTLRAFTQKPMPFDTARDEYKLFACIDTLTAAERDLGSRVAKAAQRLKTWCAEIEQWGWSGSFEQPSAQDREQRRKSIERRVREHVADPDLSHVMPPLEYWGSLLSVEVEQHEARLDDIEDEMLKLDVEELKEHVLDMHPAGRSRPSSSGYEANRQHYRVMDDFSFLITQTLLSALPNHAKLKDRLTTWTARVSILREAPRYINELDTTQKAMRLGWDAIQPPADTSDLAFEQWKEAVDTISGVLHQRVSDLGRRLDRMLDTLEGREDCLPDHWIDTFEDTEADYGRWKHESRRRVMDLHLQRQADGFTAQRNAIQGQHLHPTNITSPSTPDASMNSSSNATPHTTHTCDNSGSIAAALVRSYATKDGRAEATKDSRTNRRSLTAFKTDPLNTPRDSAGSIDEILSPKIRSPASSQSVIALPTYEHAAATGHDTSSEDESLRASGSSDSTVDTAIGSGDTRPASEDVDAAKLDWPQVKTAPTDMSTAPKDTSLRENSLLPSQIGLEEPPIADDESEFDEGDTVVHHDLDESLKSTSSADNLSDHSAQDRPTTLALSGNPTITANDGQDSALIDPPQTPRSWRGSLGSFSTDMSPDSSPHSTVEESPSVRNATNRAMRAPRPELNAAMAKRRSEKEPVTIDEDSAHAPWPPSRFSQKPANSAEELERKISDILTTIPAHIRLTSGPGPDAPEVKPARGLMAKGSRAYLRAARSVSGFKGPELTLSPAKSEFELNNVHSGRKSAAARGDNDIKLYHLTQPGKEQPIKLFIRRVGENGERVMVRVGGGWSDLGEYLRQYAEHHGRRTASEGKFEVLGLEVKQPDSSPTRPESVMSRRERRISVGYPFPSPSTTPVKSSGLGVGISSDEAPPPMPSFNASTPDISEEPIIPSTTSSRNSWQGREVGLAGPKAKKLDLSDDKLEWIEGMMKQARTVSSNVITSERPSFQREDSRPESSGGSRPGSRTGPGAMSRRQSEFGDLGKVGGTKRVFMKGGKNPFGE
ncbi:gas2 domain-containing protein [Stemphylium lycopersici]|nr:gas2 domain-containing protein [Stemphylium lycopersici]